MSSGKSIRHDVEVYLKSSALKEFEALDGSVRKKVLAQLVKIRDNPLAGEPLGNKMGADLTGYRKIYVDGTRLRIVWELQRGRLVVVVLAIGKRDKGQVYRLVLRRLGEPEVDLTGKSQRPQK